MAYRPLDLPPDLPDIVASVIEAAVEPFLADVHTMLRLPLPAHRLDAGCGFSIINVLLSVLSGASVALYSSQGGSGSLFKRFLNDYYPWGSEPTREGLCIGEQAAEELYDEFRNPFAHALGLSIKSQKDITVREVVRRSFSLKVMRVVNRVPLEPDTGLLEAAIEEIESAVERPRWLPATLVVLPHKKVASPEALYWGTRKAIEAICRDAAGMSAAAVFFKDARITPRERLPWG